MRVQKKHVISLVRHSSKDTNFNWQTRQAVALSQMACFVFSFDFSQMFRFVQFHVPTVNAGKCESYCPYFLERVKVVYSHCHLTLPVNFNRRTGYKYMYVEFNSLNIPKEFVNTSYIA